MKSSSCSLVVAVGGKMGLGKFGLSQTLPNGDPRLYYRYVLR